MQANQLPIIRKPMQTERAMPYWVIPTWVKYSGMFLGVQNVGHRTAVYRSMV